MAGRNQMAERRELLTRLNDAIARATSTKRWRTWALRLQRRIGVTPIGLAALVLVVVFWGFGKLVAGKPMYLFAYGTLLLVVVTWAAGRRKLPLTGERSEVRARAREGEILGVDLTLHAR